MATHLIRPQSVRPLDIRCSVGDVIVANLAVHVVFFFEKRLETDALMKSLARALAGVPIFAGRLRWAGGGLRIRCTGQGVPFSEASAGVTIGEAVRSVAADRGLWLVDPVNAVAARWGWGPLCTVRATHLAGGATAIGMSWHHSVGDLQTMMFLMNAWAAAEAGEPITAPLIVEDRAAHLAEYLPADTAREPGVRHLGLGEFVRSAVYLAKDARRQRTLSLYFGDEEMGRMRDAYGSRIRLSDNDIVCAHVAEALMRSDPTVLRRRLAIAVNVRRRCGLDPLLAGNILTTLSVELHSGEAASEIAERIRHHVDRFGQEHCDLRGNQRILDSSRGSQAARCVSTAFEPAHWNPLLSNWSGFGLYGIRLGDAHPCFCTAVLRPPVAGLGAVLEGAGGRGLMVQMSLPPNDFAAFQRVAADGDLHRFRRTGDQIPAVHV